MPVAAVALLLAAIWNLSPHAWSFERGRGEQPAAQASYWQPVIEYLNENLTPSYRVEVVDTAGHWAAVHLPEAGIPLVRGWFRQDDFPQNEVLYEKLTRGTYLSWLRNLGVKYVVLSDTPTDYSAKHEADLVAGGHSGLRPVAGSDRLTVFAVPDARPIVTGPGARRGRRRRQGPHPGPPRAAGALPRRRPALAVLALRCGLRRQRQRRHARARGPARRARPPPVPGRGQARARRGRRDRRARPASRPAA